MRPVAIILGIVLGLATAARAATEGGATATIAGIAAALERCQSKPDNHNTIAINGCYSDAVTAADKVLTEAYRTAVASARQSAVRHPELRKDALEIERRLVASQRAWEAYRRAECAFEASDDLGGTAEPADEMECKFDKATERVERLGQWLKENPND